MGSQWVLQEILQLGTALFGRMSNFTAWFYNDFLVNVLRTLVCTVFFLLSGNRCLCCQQLISTTTFKSNQTNKTFKIYHRANCKSSFDIYPLHALFVTFDKLVNQKHHSTLGSITTDVKNPNAIPACKHFNRHDHDFNNHRNIIITEPLRNIHTTSTETLKERLKQQENFWIMKLETLAPHGLKQDLNWIHFIQIFRSPSLFFVSAYGFK